MLAAAMLVMVWMHLRFGAEELPVASSIVLFLFLVTLSAIDIQSMRLPDWLTYPLIALGLLHNWLYDAELVRYVLAAAVGYIIVFALSRYWIKYRAKSGIGLGDAKLLAAVGAWLGPLALSWVLLIASSGGLIFVSAIWLLRLGSLSSSTMIPFGPFLSVGFWVSWIVRFL